MYIVGLDFSITSPGVTLYQLDATYNVTSKDYLSFTSVKKHLTNGRNIIFYSKKDFSNDYKRFNWLTDYITNWISTKVGDEETVIAIEGYALGAKGLIFNIAEATGILKLKLLSKGYKLRIYDPATNKKAATNHGNADKVKMCDAYAEIVSNTTFDWSFLNEYESPKNDLVDCFFLLNLLYLEVSVRAGIVLMKDLPQHIRDIFNQVSKANPTNLLTREFISI